MSSSHRGEYVVKHEKNSGMNYITEVDSKPVSIFLTTAGVTPLLPSKRYSSQSRSKVEIPFPKAFHLCNKFMRRVHLHDGHCNNVLPSIRSKKWTSVDFMRLIQASIVNALVIYSAAGHGKNKVGTKEFVVSIAKIQNFKNLKPFFSFVLPYFGQISNTIEFLLKSLKSIQFSEYV